MLDAALPKGIAFVTIRTGDDAVDHVPAQGAGPRPDPERRAAQPGPGRGRPVRAAHCAPAPRTEIPASLSPPMEKARLPETAAERRRRAEKIFDEAFPKGIAFVSIRMGKSSDS